MLFQHNHLTPGRSKLCRNGQTHYPSTDHNALDFVCH
jgi:hypothetical protein